MILTPDELTAVLKLISPSQVDYQAGRICRLLAHGPCRTGVIASKCSVGNLADVVSNTINPKIISLGLFIVCAKPTNAIRNKFGQVAGDWIYAFYRADIASNDDDYGDAGGSIVEDWEKELGPVLEPEPEPELDLSSLDNIEPDLTKLVLKQGGI